LTRNLLYNIVSSLPQNAAARQIARMERRNPDFRADGDADDFAEDLRRAVRRLAYDAYWSTQIRWTLSVWKIKYSGRIT